MNATSEQTQHRGCPTAEELAAFGVGRLPEDALERIAEHLEGCPDCRAVLAALDDRADPLLEELRRPLPAEVHTVSGAGATPPPDVPQAAFPHWAGRLGLLFEGRRPASDAVTQAPETASAAAGLPAVPGYEVLGELGRGGMGVVYRAWQSGPNRLVALKMIRAGAGAGPQELARFRTEAEAVGRLQHPNIIPIYEVGEHAGQPYLALEYVAGGSLARCLRGTPLPAASAARLVEMLARAVQHAHQRGIIHRDLTPANVLLSMKDTRDAKDPKDTKEHEENASLDPLSPSGPSSRPFVDDFLPKITDFGLAKLLVGGGPAQTQSGAIVGTPSYMAPEQAAGKTHEVGPAVDVYALGAILYECLTGRPPFRAESPLETVLQVQSAEPVPPARLRPKLPRDLETICLKCLDKVPARRYATAEALADDLGRFLRGEAVQARPVGRLERGWRWCRRNPAIASLAASLALALLAVVVGAVAAAVLSERGRRTLQTERDEKEQQREHAARARDRTFAALDAMTSTVTGDSLETQRAVSAEQKRFLAEVLAYYQEFAAEQSEDEETRKRIAAAAHRVGLIHHRLGNREAGVRAFEQARDAYGKLAAEFPTVLLYRQQLASSYAGLEVLLRELGRWSEAEAAHQQALALLARLVEDFPAVPENRRRLALRYTNLGNRLSALGKRPEAETAYRRAVALLEKLVADGSAVPLYRQNLATSLANLGLLLRELGRRPEAEAVHRQALALHEKLAHDFPAVPQYRQGLASNHTNLGMLLRELGRRPEAEAAYHQALALLEKLAEEFPAVPVYRQELAISHNSLGVLLRVRGRQPEAEAAYRRALALREQLTADFPAVPHYRQDLARSHNNLGNLLHELGRRPEAEMAYRQALELLEKLAADFPTVTAYRTELAGCQGNFGTFLCDDKRAAEALALFAQAIAVLQPLVEAEPRLALERQALGYAHWGRARTLDRLNRPAEAVADWDRAVDLARAQEKALMRAGRARARARAGQVERAVAEAVELAKALKPGATQLYGLARVYALAAGKDTPNRAEHVRNALHLLRRAAAQGFKDVEQLKKDDDLQPLRDHEDFHKLLAELEHS